MKNRIKVERAEKDITQQQLAEAVGVSRQTIVAIEKNRFLPTKYLTTSVTDDKGTITSASGTKA